MAKRVSWGEEELAKKVELGAFSSLVVREHERTLLVKEGRIKNVFKPGKYKVTKFEILKKPFAIYVSLKPFKLKVGVGGVMSKDNVEVGCHGNIQLQIEDPKMFYSQVMGGKKRYTKFQLREFVSSDIQGFLRTEIAKYEAKELYKQNDVLIPKLRVKLEELFQSLGLDFKRITIRGIKLPKKIKKALQSKKMQEIELDKEKSRFELEREKKKEEKERIVDKYKRLKEAGVDVSKFKEKEIAEKEPGVLIEKYKAMQEKNSKKYCPNCGAEVDESDKYCPKCGKKL